MKKISRGWLLIIAAVIIILGLVRYNAAMKGVSNYIYETAEVKLLDCSSNDVAKLLGQIDRLPEEFRRLLVINIESSRAVKSTRGRFVEDRKPCRYRQWFLTLVTKNGKWLRVSDIPYYHRRYPATVHCDFRNYWSSYTDLNHFRKVVENCDFKSELVAGDLRSFFETANRLLPDFLVYRRELRSCREQIAALLHGPLRDPLKGFYTDLFSGTNQCQSALELYLQLNDMDNALYEVEQDILPHKLHQDYFQGCKPFEGDMVKLYRSFFRTKMERIEGIKCRVLEIEKAID